MYSLRNHIKVKNENCWEEISDFSCRLPIVVTITMQCKHLLSTSACRHSHRALVYRQVARGNFTDEVYPNIMQECGADWVILSHPERRTIFGETDYLFAEKVTHALNSGSKVSGVCQYVYLPVTFFSVYSIFLTLHKYQSLSFTYPSLKFKVRELLWVHQGFNTSTVAVRPSVFFMN